MAVLEIGGCRGNWLLSWKLEVVVEIHFCQRQPLLFAVAGSTHGVRLFEGRKHRISEQPLEVRVDQTKTERKKKEIY